MNKSDVITYPPVCDVLWLSNNKWFKQSIPQIIKLVCIKEIKEFRSQEETISSFHFLILMK